MRGIVHPYFRHLMGTVRLCPECGRRTVWEPTRSADVAYEECPACGWFATRVAPWSLGLPPEPDGASLAGVAEGINRDLGRAVAPKRPAEILEFRAKSDC